VKHCAHGRHPAHPDIGDCYFAGAAAEHRSYPTVEQLRAAIRDVPAIDWTKSDDLTRFATDVHARLR
jgi:hypothetical protein